ncbi:MAG: hypothetical protein KC425_16655 [Anaerolineales bacterium]|nr:hypothetical protein [Anaerolineales bacterium]
MTTGQQQACTYQLALLLVLIALAGLLRPPTAVSPIPTIQTTQAPIPPRSLTPLVPGLDWFAWYETASGYTPDPTHFGAYVALGVADTLYLGLGSARPAETNGALLAAYANGRLSPVAPLTEQGVHDMVWDGRSLHVAGTDPCCGDGWEAGNHYVLTPPGPLVKLRDPVNGLPDVLHTWALWAAPDGRLYAAASTEQGRLRMGLVFRSDDAGQTWRYRGRLGLQRAYELIGWNGQLYGIYTTRAQAPFGLAYSPDDGRLWRDVAAVGMQRVHLLPFAGRLIGVSYDQDALIAVAPDHHVTRYALPAGARVGITYTDYPDYTNYNILAADAAYLYTVWETAASPPRYQIVRTADLQQWQTLAETDQPILSLTAWPAQNALVIGTAGRAASVFLLDITEN